MFNNGDQLAERHAKAVALRVAVRCPRCGGSGEHITHNMKGRVCGFCLGARTVAVEKAKAERVRVKNEAKAS